MIGGRQGRTLKPVGSHCNLKKIKIGCFWPEFETEEKLLQQVYDDEAVCKTLLAEKGIYVETQA